jgi:hypothetical protein
MNRTSAVILWLLLLSIAAVAQTPANPLAAEMKKLDFLVGEWKGQGWIEMVPGQRRTFRGEETVQRKLGGTALLIEGVHKGKPDGKDEEVIVHNALGVISYDERAKLYHFRSNLADGRYTDAEARVLSPGAMEWGFQYPGGGSMRFTISLTEKGEWREVGEMAIDGKGWRKFFEMTLQRVR